MTFSILSVGFPFAPVSRNAAGGAEQILTQLDQALVRSGHASFVLATSDSEVAGTLLPTFPPEGLYEEANMKRAREQHARALAAALAKYPIDLVHMHGLDFHTYLPPSGPPVLATLHLPVSWYPLEALRPRREHTWVNCVSKSQHEGCPASDRLLAPIENGVNVEAFARSAPKRNFALFLGRICPEKGVHLAIDAAKQAGIPLLIAGQIFPYADHQRYFEDEVRPRLDAQRRFIGPADFARKRRLLAMARCVLVASLAPETSSLVAREAAAAGTPVIALGRGALVETLVHGRTGFLVDDVDRMATAIRMIGDIDPEACRAHAREHFSHERMISAYFSLYADIIARKRAAERVAV